MKKLERKLQEEKDLKLPGDVVNLRTFKMFVILFCLCLILHVDSFES